MQLGSTLFYKAQFDVESVDEHCDALESIIDDIRTWLKDKRYDSLSQKGVEEIRRGTDCEAHIGRKRVNFKSICYDNDGAVEWAAILEERSPATSSDIDGIKVAATTWTTEFGYRQDDESASGSFSIILSYIDEPGFLGKNGEPPKPSVPKVVMHIATDERLLCSKSGFDIAKMDTTISVTGQPCTITPDTFWGLVTKPEREYPIVLFCLDDDGGIAVDAADIRSLYPNVLVCRPDSIRSQKCLRDRCPIEGLECMRSNALRVYDVHPRFDGVHIRRDLLRHRFFTWRQVEQLPNDGPNSLAAILRRALAEDVKDVELNGFLSYDEVENDVREQGLREQLDKSRNEMADYRKRLEEQRVQSDRLRKEYAEKLKSIEEKTREDDADNIVLLREQIAMEQQRREKAEKDSDEYLQNVVDLMDKNDSLEQEQYKLRAKLAGYQSCGKSHGLERMDDAPLKIAAKAFASPSNSSSKKLLEPIVKIFARYYADRIEVDDKAYKSLRDCKTSPSLLWLAMWQMCGPLYDAWNSDERGHVDDRYQDMSDYVAGFRAPPY